MKNEEETQLAMSAESLVAARLLLERGIYRIAISQSYFAMFYIASAALLRKGLAFRKHSGVISAFGRELTRPGHLPLHLHRYLLDAFDGRMRSAYGSAEEPTRDDALEQLKHAEEFVAAVRAFLEKESQA